MIITISFGEYVQYSYYNLHTYHPVLHYQSFCFYTYWIWKGWFNWVSLSSIQSSSKIQITDAHQSLCKSIINSQCINTILVLYCELGLCLPSWSTAVFLVLVHFPDSSTRNLLREPRPVEQAGSRYLPHHNINIDVWGKSFYKSTYCNGCTILHLVCPWRLWPCIRCLQYKHPAQ